MKLLYSNKKISVGIAIVFLFLVLPLFHLEEYWIYIITVGFYYGILASSWSLLVGYVGRISFAHAAMSGLGAYASVLLNLAGVPLYFSIPLATLLTLVVGLILGWICLNLHGAYLGLTTIAFSEIFRIGITAEYEFTRGTLGLQAEAIFDEANRIAYYYTFLALILGLLLLMWIVLRSRIGLFFAAIRENEDASISLGVKVVKWKTFAFAFSSAIAGLAGAFFAHFVQLISPSMMSLQEMGFILTMAVIGGFGNIFYAALGGISIQLLLEITREIGGWRMTFFGLIVILILRFMPNGIFGQLTERIFNFRGDK
jgi:branched-chain amino acid transport system permease protein